MNNLCKGPYPLDTREVTPERDMRMTLLNYQSRVSLGMQQSHEVQQINQLRMFPNFGQSYVTISVFVPRHPGDTLIKIDMHHRTK